MNFADKTDACARKHNSLLCIGLDPDPARLPASVRGGIEPLFDFTRAIIDATNDLVCAYKPNSAFFESAGNSGIAQLHKTCEYIRKHHPHIPIVLDFKRGDIGNTNDHYARYAFEYLGVDAVTVNPYLGREAAAPFLAYKDKGVIVLCRTSNPGAGEFQDVMCGSEKLYQLVARQVASEWNDNSNCALVAGAPFPEELAWVRRTVGDNMLLLVPGVGSQGGDIEATVTAGVNANGRGVLINSSREVLYANAGADFAQAAGAKTLALRDSINTYR